DLLRIGVGGEFHLLQMHLEDLHATLAVGSVDEHLAVEATCSQQCRIKYLGTAGGGEQHDPRTRVESIHLREELVERLFLLVVPTHRVSAARAPQRVEFVDEDDGRRLLARLLEQIANPCCAHAYEHLDEFRATDREERHTGLPGHGAREKRLAGARWTHEQNALGNAT